jgi:hypothetical protein
MRQACLSQAYYQAPMLLAYPCLKLQKGCIHEVHACEIHTPTTYIPARDVRRQELHEMWACKIYACAMDTHEAHAHEIHAYQRVMPPKDARL